MLIPYQIETLHLRYPIANWVIIGLCVLAFLGLWLGPLPAGMAEAMVLDGWGPGLVGHVFLHGDFWHLAGNMLFLWVFGNSICANSNNLIYPVLFVAFGVLGGVVHLLVDGAPAIGASGAINGVIGMTLAMYPINRVLLVWVFFLRGGTVAIPVWGLTLVWLLFDIWGAYHGGGGVAYWAHIGGFGAGLVAGLLALQWQWVALTEYDNRSLLEILKGEHPSR